MPIRLTEQQQRTLDSTDAEPPQVIDPRTNEAYVLIPLSVIVIKYFAEVGRGYAPWTGEASFFGVAPNKNMLGMALTTLGVSLVWALFGLRRERHKNSKVQQFVYIILIAMTAWLLKIADSLARG